MKGTIKVEFNEQSKAITASTKVEAEDVELTPENIDFVAQESKKLFEWAYVHTRNWSRGK